MTAADRAQLVAKRIIAPLVLGGRIEPIRPLGPEHTAELALGHEIDDVDLRLRVAEQRAKRARALAPVDVVADLEPAEWGMAGVLNDLLQVGNEELSGATTRGRHETLLRTARTSAEQIPAPASLGAALGRHATFARLLELSRKDTLVSWWSGSAQFRGRPPTPRLLLWPELRRVTTTSVQVPLIDMADWAPVPIEQYHQAVAALLRASPLTDLATSARALPAFRFGPASLGLLATHLGCNLALRAFARIEPSVAIWQREGPARCAAAVQALGRATEQLRADGPGRGIAAGFAAELARASKEWFGERAAA